MTTFKEDEDLLELLRELLHIHDKLEPDNNSKIKLVLSVDERKKLEDQWEELSRKLSTTKIELDRIRIRETPHHRAIIDMFRITTVHNPIKEENFNEFWKNHYEEILDFHMDNELLERGTFIRNYYKLIPPYVKVGTTIPEGIKNIYHESRWCFVYGQYNAAVAMCRTIIETVLKIKFHLSGDLNDIIKNAKERCLISGRTKWNANRVRILANKILHRAESISEKEAKDAIGYTLVFLEEIYL